MNPEWHKVSGEQFEVWQMETRNLPAILRDLADTLEANDGMILLTLVNGPGEPVDPSAFSVQVTVAVGES